MEIESQHIATVLIAVIVPLVLRWLTKSSNTAAITVNGVSWLGYSKAMKGFTFFFIAIVAALVVTFFYVAPEDKNPILGMIGLFGGITLPLSLEVLFVRIGYDSHKIYCDSIWRRNREISWSEVKNVTFSESMQWWVIDTRNSGKIRASVFLSGLNEFIQELDRRCGKNS